MELYPYLRSDVSPNALRSTWNPDRAYIGREPQRTNMSHEERIEGWCGTTSDISVTALGVVDTDDEGWFDALIELLPDGITVDREDLESWMDDDDDEDEDEDEDFECGIDTSNVSRSCTWDEADDEGYWPTPQDGWTMIAGYDQEDRIYDLSADEDRVLTRANDCCSPVAAAKILDIVGPDYDYVEHETYDSGTCGTDWAYTLVREDDEEDALRVLRLAAALLELDDVDKADMEAMLKAWWDRNFPRQEDDHASE